MITPQGGLEPPTLWLTATRSANWAIRAWQFFWWHCLNLNWFFTQICSQFFQFPLPPPHTKKCRLPGSNQGPLDLQSNALPTELSRQTTSLLCLWQPDTIDKCQQWGGKLKKSPLFVIKKPSWPLVVTMSQSTHVHSLHNQSSRRETRFLALSILSLLHSVCTPPYLSNPDASQRPRSYSSVG